MWKQVVYGFNFLVCGGIPRSNLSNETSLVAPSLETIWFSRSIFQDRLQTVRILAYSTTRGSQTKGLERGWKQRASVRLARFARVRLLRHALPISLLILRLFCSLFSREMWRFFFVKFRFWINKGWSKLSFVFFFSRLWIERIVSGKRRSLMCTDW